MGTYGILSIITSYKILKLYDILVNSHITMCHDGSLCSCGVMNKDVCWCSVTLTEAVHNGSLPVLY